MTLKRAFFLSLAAHILLALFLFVNPYLSTPAVPHETVTVEFIPPEPVAPPRPPPEHEPMKQIVEQEKSLNNEKPIKEAFLSAHDQRVEKETTAREHGEFQNKKSAKTAHNTPAGGKKAEKSLTAKSHPTLKDLLGDSPVAKLQEKRNQEDSNEGGEAQAATDASRTSDYLKNVDVSNETMLNTREFKYYTYYARIRRQLSQYWEPKVKEKLNRIFKQGRRIASDHDHITKLLIVLNDDGNLVRVQVLGESGVTDLDEAATEAFKSAAPFPNPPKGIVESDGTVKIRWDFVLES